MDKKEKILAKIGKYLGKLNDEEKNEVIEEIASMKDDEEQVEKKPTENEVGEETPTEETPGNENNAVEEKTETTEEEKVEESTDDPNPEETPAEEEVANESEEVGSEETVEDKVEEKVEEESTEEKEETPAEEGIDYKAKFEEMQKAFDGLASRLESLEALVSKLGVPTDENKFGASPNEHAVDEGHNDFLEEINRKRMGY